MWDPRRASKTILRKKLLRKSAQRWELRSGRAWAIRGEIHGTVGVLRLRQRSLGLRLRRRKLELRFVGKQGHGQEEKMDLTLQGDQGRMLGRVAEHASTLPLSVQRSPADAWPPKLGSPPLDTAAVAAATTASPEARQGVAASRARKQPAATSRGRCAVAELSLASGVVAR